MVNSHIQIGRDRIHTALLLLAKFGHLRPADLAVYLDQDNANMIKVAERIFRKLHDRSFVIKRRNALGSTSYVLSSQGAAYTRETGLYSYAKAGKDLGCSGSMFMHHTISAMGILLLMRLMSTPVKRFITEYEIKRHIDPTGDSSSYLYDDKLLFNSDGYIKKSRDSLYWLETENTAKSQKKNRQKLQWLIDGFNTQMGTPSTVKGNAFMPLAGVMFIIPKGDYWPDHEENLRRIIENYQVTHYPEYADNNAHEWYFLRLYLTERLHLKGYELVAIFKGMNGNEDGKGEPFYSEQVIKCSGIV